MIALSFIVYYSHINQSYISLAVIVGQWLHEIHQFTIVKVVTNILLQANNIRTNPRRKAGQEDAVFTEIGV